MGLLLFFAPHFLKKRKILKKEDEKKKTYTILQFYIGRRFK